MLAKHYSRPMVTSIVLPRPCLPLLWPLLHPQYAIHPQKATQTRNPFPRTHVLLLDLGTPRRPHLPLMISSRPTHTNTNPKLQGTRKVARCLAVNQKTLHHHRGLANPEVAKGSRIVDYFIIGALPALGFLVPTRFTARLASSSRSAALPRSPAQLCKGPRNERL